MKQENYAMTIKEVAKYLNVSNQMVYNLIHEKSIEAFKIGNANRVMLDDVNKYIERQKEKFLQVQFKDGMLEMRNVSASVGSFSIHDINFSFPCEKILSILGPSGSGKTVILKTLAGLIPVDSGEIFFGRIKLNDLNSAQRKIGFVFEDYALFPTMTGKKNIEFPLKIRKKTQEYIEKQTARAVKELDIDPMYLKTLPSYLPAGIQQLVAIAKGKNHELDLFVMDEPMSHLDAAHHVQMRVFLKKLVRDMKKTTIIALNDPEDALALSDYIAVIDKGSLLQIGETPEVYNNPASLTVMEMVSSLGVNTVEIEVKDGITEPFALSVDKQNGRYLLAFRPDEVALSREGLQLEIESKHYFNGSKQMFFCRWNNQEIRLVLDSDAESELCIMVQSFNIFDLQE